MTFRGFTFINYLTIVVFYHLLFFYQFLVSLYNLS